MSDRTRKIIVFFLFGAGLFPLVLNLLGLFIPPRSEDLYHEKTNLFKNDLTLRADDFFSGMERRAGESEKDYARRMTLLVNQGIAHQWEKSNAFKYRMTVPPWENYFLFAKSIISPKRYKRYEYADYKKAAERGVGLCSQHVVVLESVLAREGMEANVVVLGGHVVARVEADGAWIMADPDYGVIVPEDITEIEKDPKLVLPYYRGIEKQYADPSRKGALTAEDMVRIYGHEGNFVLRGAEDYLGTEAVYFERYSYIAKWALPVLLVLPFISWLWKRACTREDMPGGE